MPTIGHPTRPLFWPPTHTRPITTRSDAPACCIRRDHQVAWPNEQAPRARTFAAPPLQDSMHPKTGPGLHPIAFSVIVFVVYRRPVRAVFGRIGRAVQRGIRAAPAAGVFFSPSDTG